MSLLFYLNNLHTPTHCVLSRELIHYQEELAVLFYSLTTRLSHTGKPLGELIQYNRNMQHAGNVFLEANLQAVEILTSHF